MVIQHCVLLRAVQRGIHSDILLHFEDVVDKIVWHNSVHINSLQYIFHYMSITFFIGAGIFKEKCKAKQLGCKSDKKKTRSNCIAL